MACRGESLLEDFAAAYEQIQQGKSRVMLAQSHSYASWGARLQAFGQTERLAAELPYWLERGAQAELPCDDDAAVSIALSTARRFRSPSTQS